MARRIIARPYDEEALGATPEIARTAANISGQRYENELGTLCGDACGIVFTKIAVEGTKLSVENDCPGKRSDDCPGTCVLVFKTDEFFGNLLQASIDRTAHDLATQGYTQY